ncbi:MAG TPA: hypothetical protein VFT98_23215 [Myxococcota bacterium]|nr:hypothetical protein [Myxococcota bacterium]
MPDSGDARAGTWPLDAEIGLEGRYVSARHLLDLRVPAVIRSSRQLVAPGDTIELDLEAPIPTGEELEVIFRGPQLDEIVRPQQLLSTRLRVRVPARVAAEVPQIVLRVRDVESAPFIGIAVKRWMRWVRGWTAFASAGVVIGAVAAVLVVITQPAKLRR